MRERCAAFKLRSLHNEKMNSFIPITLFLLLIAASANAQTTNYSQTQVIISNDGWELKGDLLLVESKTKTAIVLMLNKANGDRRSYEPLAQLLAENNISSLRLDLRGHGESINKGKFIPFDSLNNSKINLDDTYTDIIAAHRYLFSIKQVDTNKIGMIGASYSGEEMLISARNFKKAKCYIAISPGSLSTESIDSIDRYKASMLFIKSMDEKSMQRFEEKVFASSKRAQILIVSGKSHATDILLTNPEISELITDWLKRHLVK